jgi:hypothetical protein
MDWVPTRKHGLPRLRLATTPASVGSMTIPPPARSSGLGGQAQAKPLDNGLSDIAAIADLLQKARTTGVIADAADHAPASARPDGQLISLCREALGADRIAGRARADWLPPPIIDEKGVRLGDSLAYKEHLRRLSEASRLKRQALEALIDLQAATLEGVVAKAKVLEAGPDRARSGKRALAQSLGADVLAVLGAAWTQSLT